VDALGNPIHLHLSAGNVHDATEAPRLLEAATANVTDAQCFVEAATGTRRYFIADKAYDSDALISAAQAKGMTVVIPSKSNRAGRPRKIDQHVYKERHLVENFFSRAKHFRRLATRYEKTALNFLGFALLVAIRTWMA
jgi:transposase